MRDSAVLDFRRTSNASDLMQTEDQETERVRCVYVIDDEIQVLEVIEMQLAAVGYTVKTFSRASGLLAVVEQLEPGIIVSDQRMPEIDGLHLQRELQKWKHKFPLIILTGYPETRVAVQAMKQGAVTVLDKPYNKTQLIDSIEEAFQTLDRAITDDAHLPPVLSNGAAYKDRLSGRETQVVDLVYEGETNKSIGISLGISIKTVEKHRGKAMKKMEVSSLAELIRLLDRERGQR
jgi:two-component system, LuxR family, response regulator FixJ